MDEKILALKQRLKALDQERAHIVDQLEQLEQKQDTCLKITNNTEITRNASNQSKIQLFRFFELSIV